MEVKDPVFELLSSLEQIVLTRDATPATTEIQLQPAMPEPQRLRELTGMKVDEFAKVMGVSVSSVKSWEARRTRPHPTFSDGAKTDEIAACQSLSRTAVTGLKNKKKREPATAGFFLTQSAIFRRLFNEPALRHAVGRLTKLRNSLFDNGAGLLPQPGVALLKQFYLNAFLHQINPREMGIEADDGARIIDNIGQLDGLRLGRGFSGMAEVRQLARGAIFCLRLSAVGQHSDQLRDARTEVRFNVGQGRVGVLYRIVQPGGGQQFVVVTDAAHQLGDGGGMNDIGFVGIFTPLTSLSVSACGVASRLLFQRFQHAKALFVKKLLAII